MNELKKYLFRQIPYSQMSKETGISEDMCRYEIERMNRILNPSGDLILYPERLPWGLLTNEKEN